MRVKVANRVIDKWLDITVSLRFDAVASPFSVSFYFNPASPSDRELFVPGAYNKVVIDHNGETLITGTTIGQVMRSAPTVQAISVSGYTRSGVLEDCQIEVGYSKQFQGMNLRQIIEQILKPYSLNLVVDLGIIEADTVYPNAPTIEPDQTIREFIATLCKGRNIVFTHTPDGDLLLTRANVNQEPMYNFNGSIPVTGMELSFDGQKMHNKLYSVGQANLNTNNASQNEVFNPYVLPKGYYVKTYPFDTGYRPAVYVQKTGDDNTTPLTARQYLSQELKNVRLKIDIEGWELNGQLVKPNRIVTVQNPDIFLYERSRWFVEQVDLRGDNNRETATLYCVLPECYTQGDVKNVFTGTNLTVPFGEGGAHAVITPFDQP